MSKDNEGGAAPQTATAALAEALATREQPQGIKAGVEHLRAHLDEGASVVWSTKGPRNSHIAEIAGVLAEIGDHRRFVVVLGYASGGFKLFAEVPGKTPSADDIKAMYDKAD